MKLALKIIGILVVLIIALAILLPFIFKGKIKPVPITHIIQSGSPENCVDIAFIAEGYTFDQMNKFRDDAKKMADYFMEVNPFSRFKDKFNFYALESPSREPGVTIPGDTLYVSSSVNSSFYTFDMDRYLTSQDIKSIYDIAASVPYDAIFILVNSSRYGGGGFYNNYGVITVDNPWSRVVAIHEFGHSFAGLGDEYVGNVNYSDIYNLNVEPWEPNITTNIDFNSKWKRMIPAGVPVPTPRTAEYEKTVGMFEGGGYLEKGIFSPYQDCRMNSNSAPGFCETCIVLLSLTESSCWMSALVNFVKNTATGMAGRRWKQDSGNQVRTLCSRKDSIIRNNRSGSINLSPSKRMEKFLSTATGSRITRRK